MATKTIEEVINTVSHLGLNNSQLLMREPIFFQTHNSNLAQNGVLKTATQLIDDVNNLMGYEPDDLDRVKDIDTAIEELAQYDEDRFIWEIN